MVLLCDLGQVLYPLWAPRRENDENVKVALAQLDPEDGWSVGDALRLDSDTRPVWAKEDQLAWNFLS